MDCCVGNRLALAIHHENEELASRLEDDLRIGPASFPQIDSYTTSAFTGVPPSSGMSSMARTRARRTKC